jgi:hypothetical protein
MLRFLKKIAEDEDRFAFDKNTIGELTLFSNYFCRRTFHTSTFHPRLISFSQEPNSKIDELFVTVSEPIKVELSPG